MRTLSALMLVAGAGLLAASGLASARQAPAGGAFRMSYSLDIDYVDPALAYHAPSWVLEYATGAMLLNYPDAPAPRGSRLVPEVAAGFPTVSKDGKTYTFRLKRTYRFSNGRRVTAASFALGAEPRSSEAAGRSRTGVPRERRRRAGRRERQDSSGPRRPRARSVHAQDQTDPAGS